MNIKVQRLALGLFMPIFLFLLVGSGNSGQQEQKTERPASSAVEQAQPKETASPLERPTMTIYEQVNEMLKNRELDLAFVYSGPYVKGKDDFGMEIIAVPVTHGASVYHSYFLAHKDSSFQSLDDLRGKTFAFTDPHSNTGCLVPTYVLAKQGETPASFFRETFFSYSHDNSIKMVAESQADGAAVDSLIWDFLNIVDPPIHAADENHRQIAAVRHTAGRRPSGLGSRKKEETTRHFSAYP